jgi:endonuclease/exonuclease/phosphatase family metal-dependent hydrolase
MNVSFQSYIDRKNKHIPQTGNVNLLSYNIFIRPPMINNNGNDFKDERINEFIKVLPKYDVICLQEMFGAYSNRRSYLIQKAREAGFLYHVKSPNPTALSSHFIDGGLLILSRFPIVSHEFCPYSRGIGSDYYVYKGALYAEIQIGDSRLHLYTTHAQATYDTSLKYFLKRSQQFVCFQKFVKESLKRHKYQDGESVLLTGDFNVDGRDPMRFKSRKMEVFSLFKELPNLGKTGVFSEYEALTACLSDDNKDAVENLVFKHNGKHPITFGAYEVNHKNEKMPKEAILTAKEGQTVAECLDYIFKYVPRATLESDYPVKEKLVVMEGSACVEEFFVKGHKFGQLSDHYGVKVTLEFVSDNELTREETDSAASTASSCASPSRSDKSE